MHEYFYQLQKYVVVKIFKADFLRVHQSNNDHIQFTVNGYYDKINKHQND